MLKLRINLNKNFASFASFANFASFASFANFASFASFSSFASSGSFAISQFCSFNTIQWVSPFGIRPNRFRQATLSMALPELLQNIATALDQVERGIGGDTSINPINVINGI